MPRTHIVVTEEPRGAFATVVRHPGLIIGRASVDRLLADLDDELDKFEIDGERTVHYQTFATGPDDREYVFRVQMNSGDDRAALFLELVDEVLSGEYDFPRVFSEDVAGVVGVIACERDDTIEWLGEQMEDGDAFAACVWEEPGNYEDILCRQFVNYDVGDRPDFANGADFLDATLGEIIDAAPTYSAQTGRWREPRSPRPDYTGQALSFAWS